MSPQNVQSLGLVKFKVPSPQRVNTYWTGRTYMSLPGKGWEGHTCANIVMSWLCHCDII